MRKKIFTILIVLCFINVAGITSLITMIPVSMGGTSENEPLRIGDSIEKTNYDLKLDLPSISGSPLQLAYSSNPEDPLADSDVGDLKLWLALDDYEGYYYFDLFELRVVSELTEIWVQTDLSWMDPDPQGRDYPIITDEQLQYLLEEYDDNIFDTNTYYFGFPDYHDGNNALLSAWGYVPPGYYNDSAGRNVILVENVRDANYYTDFRFFIAGFFSSSLEAYMDRNIITIDCYDWEHRVGTTENPWFLDDEDAKPNQFEGTIAHEVQHLLHADKVPGDLIIMNEGFSTFSEYLCGYGVPVGDINYYLATPDNGLLEWGEQQGNDNILADYGQAFLWTAYLHDHFGGSGFLSYYMSKGIPGLDGLRKALDYFGYDDTFHEIYHRYRIANLIHSDLPGDGMYNYETIDLGSEEFIPIRVYEVKDKYPTDITGYSFGHTVCWDDYPLYDTYLVSSYGSDYIRMSHLKWRSITKLAFDGQDYISLPDWTFDETEDAWHSETPVDTQVDMPHAAWVNVPESGVIELTFDTYYDIEDYWDYGFVQVSEDGGETWTSLENMYTTYLHESLAMGTIVANLPGLTGWSGDWITMSFDISAYHGQEIMIAFRYMTDSYENYPGWWIKNVVIEQNDDIIDTIDDFFTAHPKCNFMVTLLRVDYWKNKPYYTYIDDIVLDSEQVGEINLFPFTFKYPRFFSSKKSDVLMIVSPQRGPADYSFSVYKTHKWMPWMPW